MLTRRAFSLLPISIGFSFSEPPPDPYLEAKDLLVKGKKLAKSIELLEKSGHADSQFLILCACVGRLASIDFATLEWDAYLQEKNTQEVKKQTNPEFEISLPPVRMPDDGKNFDPSSPSVSDEIHSLAQKILSCCANIEKNLSEMKEPEEHEEALKNRHLYISALILLNRVLRMFAGKFTTEKEIAELCTDSKILIQIDKFLELQPNAYDLLYLKAIVKTLPLIHVYPDRDHFAFSLGDSSRVGVDKKVLAESISYLDTVISKSPRHREAVLYKSLLFYFLDKSKSAEPLDKFLHYNPSIAVLYLFQSELLFSVEKADPFEPLRQANAAPILGDFSFSLPIRFETKNCFGYLKWTSGLVLARSLSALFSYAEGYFHGIKPEDWNRDHLSQIEALLNIGLRTIETFRKQNTSTYQEIASYKTMVLMGIVNVYSAYEIVKKSDMLSSSKEKSDFLEKYGETIEYVKKIDAEIT
ncbi:MAG: hypothetical protein QM758_21455 [Armatimonas sp.]